MVFLIEISGDASISRDVGNSNPEAVGDEADDVIMNADLDDDDSTDKDQGGKESGDFELVSSVEVDV